MMSKNCGSFVVAYLHPNQAIPLIMIAIPIVLRSKIKIRMVMRTNNKNTFLGKPPQVIGLVKDRCILASKFSFLRLFTDNPCRNCASSSNQR